jgi:hypothetical protein
VQRALAEQPALPVYVLLTENLAAKTRADLATYGLGAMGPCMAVPNHAQTLAACLVRRVALPGPAALPLAPGDTLRFGTSMQSAAAMLSGWHLDSAWGVIGGGYRPSLQLRLDPAFGPGPLRVTIGFAGFTSSPADTVVSLSANGRPAGETKFDALSASKTLQACIGPEALGGSRDLVLALNASAQFSAGLASVSVAAGCPG